MGSFLLDSMHDGKSRRQPRLRRSEVAQSLIDHYQTPVTLVAYRPPHFSFRSDHSDYLNVKLDPTLVFVKVSVHGQIGEGVMASEGIEEEATARRARQRRRSNVSIHAKDEEVVTTSEEREKVPYQDQLHQGEGC
jgi:hypothetical protein